MEEQQHCVFKSAVFYDGLADLSALAVKVVEAAPGERDARVGLQFLASTLLAQLRRSLQCEPVFQGEQDHAHGGCDGAKGVGAHEAEAQKRVCLDCGHDCAKVQRPGEEANSGKQGSR